MSSTAIIQVMLDSNGNITIIIKLIVASNNANVVDNPAAGVTAQESPRSEVLLDSDQITKEEDSCNGNFKDDSKFNDSESDDNELYGYFKASPNLRNAYNKEVDYSFLSRSVGVRSSCQS